MDTKPIDIEPRKLHTYPLFQGLIGGTIRDLWEAATKRDYKSRDKIVTQGERGSSLYLVEWGEVGIFLETGSDFEGLGAPLGRLTIGKHFGEKGYLFPNSIRSASVYAMAGTRLRELNRATVAHVLSNIRGGDGTAFYENMAKRLVAIVSNTDATLRAEIAKKDLGIISTL